MNIKKIVSYLEDKFITNIVKPIQKCCINDDNIHQDQIPEFIPNNLKLMNQDSESFESIKMCGNDKVCDDCYYHG